MIPKEFQSDPELRLALRRLLDDPTFQTAVSLIKDEEFEPAPGLPSGDTVKKVSLFDQRAGVNLLLKRLNDLTHTVQERKPLTVKSLAKSVDDLPQTD